MLLDKLCSLISFVADKICFDMFYGDMFSDDMFCMGSVEMYMKLRIMLGGIIVETIKK